MRRYHAFRYSRSTETDTLTQTQTHILTTLHDWHDDDLLLGGGETEVKGRADQPGRNGLQQKLDDVIAVLVHKLITLQRNATK